MELAIAFLDAWAPLIAVGGIVLGLGYIALRNVIRWVSRTAKAVT